MARKKKSIQTITDFNWSAHRLLFWLIYNSVDKTKIIFKMFIICLWTPYII